MEELIRVNTFFARTRIKDRGLMIIFENPETKNCFSCLPQEPISCAIYLEPKNLVAGVEEIEDVMPFNIIYPPITSFLTLSILKEFNICLDSVVLSSKKDKNREIIFSEIIFLKENGEKMKFLCGKVEEAIFLVMASASQFEFLPIFAKQDLLKDPLSFKIDYKRDIDFIRGRKDIGFFKKTIEVLLEDEYSSSYNKDVFFDKNKRLDVSKTDNLSENPFSKN